MTHLNASQLSHYLTSEAVVLRPQVTGAQFGDPVEHISCLKISSPFPVDPQTKERMGLSTQKEIISLYCQPLDIQRNDFIQIDSRDYPVAAVADWPHVNPVFLQLYLEDIKDATR